MDESTESTRRKHGGLRQPVVCRHINKAFESERGRAVGFHSSPSDRKVFPDAWCTACDKALVAAGGEWTPDVVKRMALAEICGCCYDLAKAMCLADPLYQSVRWR